jgi:hypothetical protein
MYKFPVIELVDRYCIAKLKFNKLGNNQEELNFYTDQIKELNLDLIKDELERLYEVHRQVWEVEDEFKKRKADTKYELEEIGRRALYVRDIMVERYELKNVMAEKLDDPVRERKKYGDFTV